ncbi:MAG: hypothetical protein R2810_00955 [Flavobacteriales bacterium]|nr:hypothetical protein [Flavobacteriales bacterium]MCB0784388.1 hypothetical protein [Flavobacteriales bacterium]MCB0788770.1 hypothetical protein [Flavobacteriales bacterium]MCB0809749.1 hypothetical protein [Flavobacteriales bacterium]MCB0812617.1 hypothetical protein [Flavobacteriales bacterium]
MKIDLRTLLIGLLAGALIAVTWSFRPEPQTTAFAWRQFSTIESVVPGGIGRSRIIISDDAEQEIGKDLLNFYSLTGINFKNIANNDRLIVQTIDDYTSQGWELYTVTTGVQSPAENKGGTGIYMTRYLFRRPL